MTSETTNRAPEICQEEPRGRAADLSLVALPGVEIMRSFLDGESPLAPVARLTGRRLVAVEHGAVTFELPKSDWLVSGKGRLHAGVLAFLADASLTGAIQAALPARSLCTTAELSMTFCGLPPRAGGTVRAEARCIHLDDAMGLAEVFVRDDDGSLVAHGTSRTLVHPPIPDDVDLGPAATAAVDPDGDAGPDPYARPLPEDTVADAPDPAGMSGLEVLQAVLDGTLGRAPVDRLFGARLVAAEKGTVTFTLPAHGWLVNEFGGVYGGSIAFLAKSAAAAAVQTVPTRGTTYTALDLKVNFLRPVPPDGADLTATGTVLHRGRQLVISSAQVTHGGKTVAIATGTTALAAG